MIPAGAIPEGVKQEVYFKVCQDNSIMPPLDKDKGTPLHCCTVETASRWVILPVQDVKLCRLRDLRFLCFMLMVSAA